MDSIAISSTMMFSLDELWIHPYQLVRRGGFSKVEGVLLRWGEGIGCLQPWPHLGTATLEEELAALRLGKPLTLARRALAMAALDGLGRMQKRSLWDEVMMPFCHRLVFAEEVPSEILLRPVKIKVGEDLQVVRPWLDCAYQSTQKVRLDPNSKAIEVATWLQWWQSLAQEERGTIELIEDPLPREDVDGWKKLALAGIPLAWDWERPLSSAKESWFCQAGVYKPAWRSGISAGCVQAGKQLSQLVVTGMLGHPLGELYAAWIAARWMQSPPAGWRVSSWHGVSGWETLEDAETWTALLGPDEQGQLKKPSGWGLGLSEQLQFLTWQRLV